MSRVTCPVANKCHESPSKVSDFGVFGLGVVQGLPGRPPKCKIFFVLPCSGF